jgi:hypothetical protein
VIRSPENCDSRSGSGFPPDGSAGGSSYERWIGARDWAPVVVFHVQIQHRSDASKGVGHDSEQRAIAQPPNRVRGGWMPAHQEHPVILYDYTPTRERAGPEKILAGYRGYLQADAYGGYDAFFKDPARGLIEVGRWAHCRRCFRKALESDPARMGWPCC